MAYLNPSLTKNPFPGLRAYRPDEGHLFFGRIESTLRITSRLKENRFVAVLGASGSGKSSLVMSGVLPALLKENEDGKRSWSYVIFRPEASPIENLAAELAALSSEAGFNQLSLNMVTALLHNRSEGLPGVINKIRKNLRQQIVIVIDQFEEIFRYSPVASRGTLGDDATDFIDLVVDAAGQPDQGLYFVITIRSEYVSECSRFHSLTNLMNGSSYLLPQLSRETLSTVIEEPVKVSGVTIDRSLVKTIIADLGDRPGYLPVVQHLMMRLYNQWQKGGDSGRPIGYSDYEAVGRLRGAMAMHAGQALESLDERHRYVCSRLFRSITVRTEDGRDLRRPEKISAIAAMTGCTEGEIMSVAELFRSPEYSFLTPPAGEPLGDSSIIDLTHESIMKLWGTLHKWIDEEETSRKIYLQLAGAAANYQEGKGKLWGPPDLLMAIRWREQNKPTLAWAERLDPAFERTMLFLKNSEEEYIIQEEYSKKSGKNKIRRSRFMAGFFGLLAILCIIAFGSMHRLKVRAERQKSVAIEQKEAATAYNSELSDSIDFLSDTLRAVSDRADSASTLAAEASGRVAEAENKAETASRQTMVAEQTAAAATEEAAEKSRLRMLSLGRSLAVRSLNHAGEQDLQVLLAWQGCLFNERYAGPENDADMFAALYDISRRYGNRHYYEVNAETYPFTAMAGDPGGKIFYTADSGGRVMRWQNDRPDGGCSVIWSGNRIIEAMTVSPDATWLACGTSDSEIIMIPLTGSQLSYQLEAGGGKITALVFNNTGDRLYSSSLGGAVAVWDLKSRTAEQMANDSEAVVSLDLSNDGKILAGITADGRLLLWNSANPGKQFVIDAGDRTITSLRFIPGEEKIITGDRSGIIDIWNTSGGEPTASLEGHNSAVTGIAVNTRLGQLVTSDDSGEIRLWSLADMQQPPAVIDDCTEKILGMAFNENACSFTAVSDSSVIQRPAHVRCMTAGLCSKVTRNLSPAEWTAFMGDDIAYEETCPGRTYRIRVRSINRGGY